MTVTDANLVLGRLHQDFFPKIFGTNENEALDLGASKKSIKKLTKEINIYSKKKNLPEMSHEEVALGFLRVANEVMVRPIREISVMRGFDIKEHALACLGVPPDSTLAQLPVSLVSQKFLFTVLLEFFLRMEWDWRIL